MMNNNEYQKLSLYSLKICFEELKGSLAVNDKISFDSESKTACINLEDWKIKINPYFVHELMDKGLSEEDVYKGLIIHELGHFKHHPFNLETSLLEIDALEKKGLPLGIKGAYDDFICNSRIILQGDDEKLSLIYKVLESDGILGTLNCFYNYLSKYYGLSNVFSDKENTPAQAEQVEKLKKININSDRNLHPYYLLKFYEIFKDEQMPDESLGDLLKELSDQYGKKKLADTIKKLKNEGEIGEEEACKYLKELNMPLDTKFDEHVNESKKYSISVQKLRRTGSKYSSPHSPAKAGVEDLANYDPLISFASGGKAIPGLANYWINEEDGFLEEYSTLNDLVLMVDSSGSMTNPNNELSPAIVSAMTVANYYIANNKDVAVVNFSDNTLVKNFSKDKDAIFSQIFSYQGKGTTLDIKNINLDFNNKDVLIITDEAITNYEDTVNFLKSKKSENNHVYIISITGNNSQNTDNGINRISIQNPKDIPKIVIGEQQ